MGEVTGGKPIRPQDQLGLDVKMESKELGSDPWAYKMIGEIGKQFTPDDMEYMGSIAIHYYKTKSDTLAVDRYSVATAHQIAVGDMREYIAVMGVTNLVVKIKEYYGRVHRTRDPNDKRGAT